MSRMRGIGLNNLVTPCGANQMRFAVAGTGERRARPDRIRQMALTTVAIATKEPVP
jgi:hypothetical protein